MNDVLVMLLAGGVGSRLNILGRRRAKPAVPFAGSYRIIDFTLSNVTNAGFGRVGVLTQYRPTSLMQHLGNGMAWDLWGKTKCLRVLPPFQGREEADWFRGTSDAVHQNLDFIRRYAPSRVVILSGDHVYRMDYDEMLRFHEAKRADVTLATVSVPWEEASRFGLVGQDAEHRVVEFDEKPARPRYNLASMGVYIFNTDVLEQGLAEASAGGGHDFGKHVIPLLFNQGRRIFSFPFRGYWRDVGTLQSYWDANMDCLRSDSELDLRAWKVRTNLDADGTTERPAPWIGAQAEVRESLVSRGCVIEGTVHHSILSPGVRVRRGAVVRDSIIMHEADIGEGALLDRAILDKAVRVGARTMLGAGGEAPANLAFPEHLNTGLTIVGKEAHVPSDLAIGRNCLVFPGVRPEHFTTRELPGGETVRGDSAG